MSIEMAREDVIQYGIQVFRSIGAHYICEVCIESGNSCCFACDYLQNGIGCQKRNTSCTAWLCGIQKFFFREIGLIDEWEHFWSQIPGQMFRDDKTPDKVNITSFINIQDLDDSLGKIAAEKLIAYRKIGGDIGGLELYLENKYVY
ncbi:DNA mismatch repair protein [Bacillus taeanensis]|uniref:DNA mismatch repair protein n=1 Tax=Bacillus taeanensis TaxID=273032 RepID=A0A366XU05_9BACI|nr:DNA mismatch repair protein [Bacillus taeanensis]RBW69622.1 DNA mismatch repair protein [Bacillus taeanensis]